VGAETARSGTGPAQPREREHGLGPERGVGHGLGHEDVAFRQPWKMINPIQRYAWGSTTRISGLQGRPATDYPEAELWMGAHPAAPSDVVLPDGLTGPLPALVEAAPLEVLGRRTQRRFGTRLPYLLKVLGVEHALSLQVHPDRFRAAEGFVLQETRGIDRNSAQRLYADPYPKPEFLYALTPFEALAGCRPGREAADTLAVLDLPELAPVVRAARYQGTAAAIGRLARWPAADRPALVARIRAACLERRSAPLPPATQRLLALVLRLVGEHPGDPLVLAPALLRLHDLPPGGTMFVPPGVLHAYLSGTAVEIMSASDNVVRAGLTTKHVDVPELLDVLAEDHQPLLSPPTTYGYDGHHCRTCDRADGESTRTWTVPAREFALTRERVEPGAARPRRVCGRCLPQVVLCITGEVGVRTPYGSVELTAGTSAFLPAGCVDTAVAGDGVVFRAAPGVDEN